MLDFMQPDGAGGWSWGLDGEAWLDEADRQGTRTHQHRQEDSSARTNREPFHQHAGEIANLESRRNDSYLKRDPSCRDLPRKANACENRPGRDDCWHENEEFESQLQHRTDENTGNYGGAHKHAPINT
jgi:hypothetical protein